MKVFITGVTGFIGSCLADALLSSTTHEYNVIGTGYLHEQAAKVPVVHWTDAGNVDCVIHLAARNDTQSLDKNAMFEANYWWPQQMFDFYYQQGVRKFIFASSGAVHDNLTFYAQSKSEFEDWANIWYQHRTDVSCIGFRFSNVWDLSGAESHKGNRASMVYQIYNKIKNKQNITLFNGVPTRDFIHVQDVVACLTKALHVQVSGIFDLGSGIPVSFEDVVKYCDAMLGTSTNPDYIDCPFPDTYQFRTCMDISRTKSIFGWEPTIIIR